MNNSKSGLKESLERNLPIFLVSIGIILLIVVMFIWYVGGTQEEFIILAIFLLFITIIILFNGLLLIIMMFFTLENQITLLKRVRFIIVSLVQMVSAIQQSGIYPPILAVTQQIM